MLSVLLPARNGRDMTAQCLQSLFGTCAQMLPPTAVEFILMDDASNPAEELIPLFLQFKQQVKSRVRILRFKSWQHYTGVFAHGLSLAEGDNILFISNDMILTPAFLRTVLAVSALDRSIGIVRGRSAYCDSHPDYAIPMSPSMPPRTIEDINAFADYVSQYHGLHYRQDEQLSGDCVLIRRELINKIGIMDTRFFGYFGDPDYGLRAQRNGFKLVCALGAWLQHHGGGHVNIDIARNKTPLDVANKARMDLVHKAFQVFRTKWGPAVAPTYDPNDFRGVQLGLTTLRTQNDPSDYIPPLKLDASICDLL